MLSNFINETCLETLESEATGEVMEVTNMETTAPIQMELQSIKAFNCCGTFGTMGTAGGCCGTFGTLGCIGN